MWVTPNIRKLFYEEKAENPDISLTKIMDNIANNYRELKRKEKKNNDSWQPKI